ncbi:MAG: hypothetical protein M1835_005617 [Candelina submexicana]|nr:MAG: hypothetical protein M1835_005617 [Candelina submexicana]
MAEAQPPPSELASAPGQHPFPEKPASRPPNPGISSSPLSSLIDSKISRLNSILSTTSGQDTTLLTLSYTLILLTSTLPSLNSLPISSLRIQKSQPPSSSSPTSSRFLRTITSLRALADLISDVRIFLRLWGLLGIWSWGASVYRDPPKDRVLEMIAWLQVGANAIYQGLENGAYLSSHGIFDLGGGKGGKREAEWWLWSSRFWAAHVGLEFGRLGRVLIMKKREEEERKKNGQGQGEYVEKSGDGVLVGKKGNMMMRRREAERWWREFGVNLAYAPLVVHWSLEKGCVGDRLVGALGSVAGVLGFREVWRQTA